MTPETKKTLIYGGVISFAVGAGLYIWSRYQQGGSGSGTDAAAAAQAQAQADASAAAQETQLAELAQLSGGGGGGGLPSVSLGNEAPPDNFAHEIASILNAAGLGAPTNTPTGTPPATTGLPQPTPPAPPKESGPVNAPKPVGPERIFSHLPANYPTTIQ